MATLKDIESVLADAAESITAPIGNITSATTQAYHRHLADLPADLLRAAVDLVIQTNSAFFPSIESIRTKARELQTLAFGIPSPVEAWGMVLDAKTFHPAVKCETAFNMSKEIDKGQKSGALIGGNYIRALRDLRDHEESCGVCAKISHEAEYAHKAVAETVRLMGGRDNVFTDNPSADRARFIEAFKDVVDREMRILMMTPAVRNYLQEHEGKKLMVDAGVNEIAKRLSAPMKKVSAGPPENKNVSRTPLESVESAGDQQDIIEQERSYAMDRGE